MKVGIAGAGGHGRTVADAVSQSAPANSIVFLDDAPKLRGSAVFGVFVVGDLASWSDQDIDEIALGIGENQVRRIVAEGFQRSGARLSLVIHPRATVSKMSTIGLGAVVLAAAVINPNAAIGIGSIVNTGAIVEHDCKIGDFAHLAPGSCLGGGATIETGALVGLGARVLPGVRVGRWATVGAGAVVVRDVEDNTVVAGVPARRLT